MFADVVRMACMSAVGNAISISEALEILSKRRGKPPNRNTIFRWIKQGCRGVRLGAEMQGGIWFTSLDAINEFCATLTSQHGGHEPVTKSSDFRRQVIETRRQLEHGVNGSKRRKAKFDQIEMSDL